MPKSKPSHRRVAMAKRLARRWIKANVRPEYRITVYMGPKGLRNLPGLLRSFRDGKIKVGSVDPVRNLGVKAGFDHVELWSANREGLVELDEWLQAVGCETTGVW